MSVIAINKDSYTEQIIKVLRHEIETGALPPLSKLPSTRVLAEKFGVSKTVILFALNELEKSRLIVRKARSGVYVSEMASNPDFLEVLIFVFDHNVGKQSFINRILSVVSSKAAGGKVNFYSRIVNLASFQNYSKDYILRLVKAEIAKLSQTFHSDCAMIIAPPFKKEEIIECVKLPFPTVFLGNFEDGDYEDISYNRIGFEENHYDFLIDYAKEKNFKEVFLVIPDVLKQRKGSELAIKHAELKAKESHIKVSCFWEKNSRHKDIQKREQGRIETANEILASKKDKTIIGFDSVLEIDKMIDYLAENGFPPRKDQHEFAVSARYTNRICEEGIVPFDFQDEDIELFNQYLCNKLHDLAAGQLKNYRFDYKLNKTIRG